MLATSATFFQRTFDQLQQELALNHVPATLLIFGAGISGADNTHSGTFDMTMFANVPDVTCLAPASGEQMLDMLAWGYRPSEHGVVAIRMPGEQILALERAADMAFDRCSVPKSMIQPSILPEHARSPAIRSFSPAGMWRFLDSAIPCRWLPELRRALAENDEEHAAITATPC